MGKRTRLPVGLRVRHGQRSTVAPCHPQIRRFFPAGGSATLPGAVKLLTYSYALILSALALLAGCGGPVVSPSDQSLIQQADELHARLRPALVEDRDPKIKRYL